LPGNDRFESASYSNDMDLYEPSIGDRISPITDFLKQHKGIVIGIIIIAVIGYFAYDYFIGSYRTIEFSLENTEGEGLSAQVFKIYDSAGNKVFETSGDSFFSTRLKTGSYKIEARASSDYETVRPVLDVSDNASETIEFEKNISAEISGFKENFPETLVAGQSAEFDFFVENKGTETQEIEFVASKSLEELNIEIPKATVAGHGSETVHVSLKVPAEKKIENEKDGDELDGYIRIKYTNTKESVPSTAKIFPVPQVEFSSSKLIVRGDAGESILKNFSLENKSSFTVENITLKFEITSISKNSESEILNAITLTEGTQVDSLGAKRSGLEEHKNNVRFEIPLTAQKEEITANVIAESPMFPKQIIMPVVLEIREGADFGLSLSTNAKTESIDYEEATGVYEKISAYIKVKNTGNLDITNIAVGTQNPGECNSNWLKFKENSISILKAGENRDLLVEISAPLINTGETMKCKIEFIYTNPVTPSDTVNGEMNDWIQITPRA